MTPEIAIVLGILAVAVVLFVTEWIRVDLVALLVLVSLALTRLIQPAEALSGFSNLAVVTVWAVLILSAALGRTGVASLVGRQVLRVAGGSEARLIAVIMLTVGVLSGFMNDIGVAALMLPVTVDIARRTDRPPSRLLIPLAFASLLGGLNTLIGTPPNILVSEALRQFGERPFGMFDYTPVGVVVMLSGIVFMVFIGRHLLPSRDIRGAARPDPGTAFDLHERLFVVQLPDRSVLEGKTLVESRLGAALGLNVVGIVRGGRTELAPGPNTILHSGDGLLVTGRADQLGTLGGQRHLTLETESLGAEQLSTMEIGVLEVTLPPGSDMVGMTLETIGFRQVYRGQVQAIRRGDEVFRTALDTVPLEADDRLLVQAPIECLAIMDEDPRLQVNYLDDLSSYRLEERLMKARVPEGSLLVGRTLLESRLGDAYALEVLGIERGGVNHMLPGPEDVLEAGDVLALRGERHSLDLLEGLHGLEIGGGPDLGLGDLESDAIGLAEVVLSPYSRQVGKTLTQLHFREKYGLNVLAVWRGGTPIRSNLRHLALRLGDALLLHGPREKLGVLGADPDFLVLAQEAQEAPNVKKAPVALGIMALVLIPVIAGWLPIAISAVAGVVLMVVFRCLTMEEAYRAIEWKAVFLIAGMLPLGVAMERTGAAQFLAEGMVSMVGGLGPMAVMIALFLLAALASQVMPNPAVAVLLAPIAYNTAVDLGISPYPLMMAIAVSASAAFLSPVGHSANVLVMGPGGYRFSDYMKVGIPLTIVVLLVVVAVMPVFWPF